MAGGLGGGDKGTRYKRCLGAHAKVDGAAAGSGGVPGPLAVVPYDPRWPGLYEAWAGRLRLALGGRAVAIDHMGSTAVPGCAAKPIVDVLVARRAEAGFEEWRRLLEPWLPHARLDSTGRGEGQWFFRDLARTVHVHVHLAGSLGHRRHLAFRDALRRDPGLRDAYAELKGRLARSAAGMEEYIAGKEAFVRAVEAAAGSASAGPA
jgi:GrpB-like predicted nucleotidyltransferase (UPF0157 family)